MATAESLCLEMQAYRGALVGAFLGDCIGRAWESASWERVYPLDNVTSKIDKHVQDSLKNGTKLKYTDDSAMTRGLARAIVEKNGFDIRHIAFTFQDDYHKEPWRGYGGSVRDLFFKLKNMEEGDDVFRAAEEQFDGQGSFGNGSAMRVSPIALYCKDQSYLRKCAEESSKVTHAHSSAVLGGILQALAVRKAIDLHVSERQVDPLKFVNELKQVMEDLETSEIQSAALATGLTTYKYQFDLIKQFLERSVPPDQQEVYEKLGHGISAVEAVCCAIYAFLRCADKSFSKLVPYAISLGGDTDTIASMAGAVGGAYWGVETIPQDWVTVGEGTEEAVELADKLHELVN